MHRINDAVIHDGKLVLANLPFAEGQHVHVLVTLSEPGPRLPIEELRRQLKGTVEYVADPSEPMIALDDWEMLK
jgi:hypothetical protein